MGKALEQWCKLKVPASLGRDIYQFFFSNDFYFSFSLVILRYCVIGQIAVLNKMSSVLIYLNYR